MFLGFVRLVSDADDESSSIGLLDDVLLDSFRFGLCWTEGLSEATQM